MNIIAKTEEGFLLSATEDELKAIFSAISKSVTEKNPIQIGDKVPAFDYASTINSCKAVKNSYDFKRLKESSETVNAQIGKYIKTIESLTFEK